MPSVDALEMVARDYVNLDRIADTAEAIESSAVARKGAQPKQPDYVRYLMILGLSNVYARVFHRRPSATIDGPWCKFLAGILSCCEPKSMNIDGAYDVWREVRDKLSNSSRGGIVDSNFKAIFDSLGEVVEITTTGGDTTLTDSQELVAAIQVEGTLASNATITFSGRGGFWIIENNTQGEFTVTAKVADQSGVVIPQGELRLISCKGAKIVHYPRPAHRRAERGFN
jgi:hypothetical protein